jgi:hypothetical protein
VSWIETEDGDTDVVLGDCRACRELVGTLHIADVVGDTFEIGLASRRVLLHFAAVLHLPAP